MGSLKLQGSAMGSLKLQGSAMGSLKLQSSAMGSLKLQGSAMGSLKVRLYLHLIVDDHVVLGSHVVCDVVVHNQSEQPVEQRQVNLLVHLLKT